MDKLPVKGNWFPDAFVGSMGALQSYVEGSARSCPSDSNRPTRPWLSSKQPIAPAPVSPNQSLSEKVQPVTTVAFFTKSGSISTPNPGPDGTWITPLLSLRRLEVSQ